MPPSVELGSIARQGPIDLENARQKSYNHFNPEIVETILRNGVEENSIRKEVLEVIKNDSLFGDWKRRSLHLSREQIMDLAHEACRRVYQVAEENHWTDKHTTLLIRTLELGSLLLHDVAFTPVILSQGGNEQQERWASKCLNKEIIGCYLQTELGHGSNVQFLETIAEYFPETEEFVIHSPTLTSSKWWIGALGLTATHGVVQAQLIIKGKRYGPHLFFLPLRDIKTGKPFDGIIIGDIGPKAYAGYASTDNGFCRFNKVKIPRNNMLNKFSKVETDGTYIKPPSSKLSYGGMVYIRATMIESSGMILSKGVTIVSRYSTVRRQFKSISEKKSSSSSSSNNGNEQQELQVIEYPHLHRRLLNHLSNSYGFIFTGKRMFELYLELSEKLKKGDVSMLDDIHLATSSLKVYTSRYTIDALEELRSMCGGHGFSAHSGFTHLFPSNAPSVTYEGENWVLVQQVGRGLLKRASEQASNPTSTLSGPISFLSYLYQKIPIQTSISVEDWLKPEIFTSFLKIRTALRLQSIISEMKIEKRKFEEMSFDFGELGKSYGESIVSIWFFESLLKSKVRGDEKSFNLLKKLYILGSLNSIYRDLTPLTLSPLQNYGIFEQTKPILDAKSIFNLDKAIRNLIQDLYPHIVILSDGFGHDDWELSSSLGKFKGDVYENVYLLAEGNPINHGGFKDNGKYTFDNPNFGKNVSESWIKFIGPLLEENARRSGGKSIVGDGSKL